MQGFTLVELMVSLAVLGVLMSVSAPAMRPLVASVQIRTVGFDLIGDLTLARSEALKRGAQVVVSPSAAGWAGGWTVNVGGNTDILSQRNRLGLAVSVNPAPSSITFDASGRVANASTTVRIGLADTYAHRRCVSIDPTGRPKSMSFACPAS